MKTLKFLGTNLRQRLKSLFQTNIKVESIYFPIIKAGVVNSNGRIYDQDCVNDMHRQIQEKIKSKSFFGTILSDTSLANGTVNLLEVSHLVVDSKLEGDVLKAKILVLDTPNGRFLTECMLTHSKSKTFVFRPSGFGDVSPANKVINYNIIAVNAIPVQADSYRGIL